MVMAGARRPRLSVVIPTRDRATTLAATLRTCVAQEFDDCEILVSDNASGPLTRETVAAFGDPRIRYVRTPGPLAMSDSWEFGLDQAQGEYLMVVGDDDGLLLHALSQIDRLLRELGARALRWDSVCYVWPDVPVQPFAAPNELLIPLGQVDYYFPIVRRNAVAAMQEAAHGVVSYSHLPSFYCSAIHRSLVEELRRRGGRLLRSRCPDVYSAFALAYVAAEFYSLSAPMNINALSGRSTGVGELFLAGRSAEAVDFERLNRLAGYSIHPTVPALPAMPALVADAFQHARDALFPSDPELRLDRRRIVAECMRLVSATDVTEWGRVLDTIRRALADAPELIEWFDREYAATAPDTWPRLGARTEYRRYGWRYLHLDAAEFGIRDVWDVARFCESLLGLKRDGLNAHVVPSGATPAPPPDAVASPLRLAPAAPSAEDLPPPLGEHSGREVATRLATAVNFGPALLRRVRRLLRP